MARCANGKTRFKSFLNVAALEGVKGLRDNWVTAEGDKQLPQSQFDVWWMWGHVVLEILIYCFAGRTYLPSSVAEGTNTLIKCRSKNTKEMPPVSQNAPVSIHPISSPSLPPSLHPHTLHHISVTRRVFSRISIWSHFQEKRTGRMWSWLGFASCVVTVWALAHTQLRGWLLRAKVVDYRPFGGLACNSNHFP